MRTVLLVLALVILPLVARRVDPNAYEGGRSRDPATGAQRNRSAAALLVGELRTSFSDMMYIKTERYLHSGVEYHAHAHHDHVQMARTESLEDEHAEHDHDPEQHAEPEEHEHQHDASCDHGDHEEVATLIPSPEKDFRGFIGWLERQVKPWRDPSLPHLMTDGTELLPWFRIMTLSDPQYIRGYAVGGWWLMTKNPDAALAFVQEGVQRNPRSFEILFTLGQIHRHRARSSAAPEVSRREMQAALEAFQRATELGLSQRPDDWTEDQEDFRWNHYMEGDLLAAARLAVLVERRLGAPAAARQRAIDYARRLPEDEILRALANESAP